MQAHKPMIVLSGSAPFDLVAWTAGKMGYTGPHETILGPWPLSGVVYTCFHRILSVQ